MKQQMYVSNLGKRERHKRLPFAGETKTPRFSEKEAGLIAPKPSIVDNIQ